MGTSWKWFFTNHSQMVWCDKGNYRKSENTPAFLLLWVKPPVIYQTNTPLNYDFCAMRRSFSSIDYKYVRMEGFMDIEHHWNAYGRCIRSCWLYSPQWNKSSCRISASHQHIYHRFMFPQHKLAWQECSVVEARLIHTAPCVWKRCFMGSPARQCEVQ